jgi:hypothetical protein
MAKRTGLSKSLLSGSGERVATPTAEPPAQAAQASAVTAGPKWREPAGTKRINFRISEDTHRQLKILAAQLGQPMEALIIEQINRLFAEHDLPQIAGKSGG